MKMIYDADPYLMPYREAIDARHARILDMKRHIAIGFTRNVFAFPNHSCDAFYDAIDFKDRDWPEG